MWWNVVLTTPEQPSLLIESLSCLRLLSVFAFSLFNYTPGAPSPCAFMPPLILASKSLPFLGRIQYPPAIISHWHSLFCPFLTSFCICRYLFLPLSPLLTVCRKWNKEEGRLYRMCWCEIGLKGGGLMGMAGGDGGACSESDMCSVWPMKGRARCESSSRDLTLSFPAAAVHTWTHSLVRVHTHLSIL